MVGKVFKPFKVSAEEENLSFTIRVQNTKGDWSRELCLQAAQEADMTTFIDVFMIVLRDTV